MLALLLAAQIAASSTGTDSVYATPGLRVLVARASEQNRVAPPALRAYSARVESEMAIAARRADGAENTFTVEQVENVVRWAREGTFEQRVIGYRAQSIGLTVSAVGLFSQAWAVPHLYGNRIALFFGLSGAPRGGDARRDTTASRRARRQPPIMAVHPFAEDREQFYRFHGGDTTVVIRVDGREIPIIRVDVAPVEGRATGPTVLFRGEIDVDAVRAQIVRLRGHFVTARRRQGWRERVLASQVEALAFVELVNGEFESRYWLPTYQRFEAQAAIPVLGDQRAVFRVVSRFTGHTINPVGVEVPAAVAGSSARVASSTQAGTTGGADLAAAAADTLRLVAHRLTFAARDSIDAFEGWSRRMGELTGEVHADDFADVAFDAWRPTGRPLLRVRYSAASDLYHYNRVEGPYTGVGVEAKLRDAAPGVTARVTTGWAWAERTARGRLSIERQRDRWSPFFRIGRSLDVTNDFREPFDSGSALSALIFSVDDYDYVDRRTVVAGITRSIGKARSGSLRLEGGVGSDRYSAARRVMGPLLRQDSTFRPNRGVDEGRYAILSAKAELNPDVNAAFVRPGFGALLQYDRAQGELDWQRAEVRLVARAAWGPLIYAARLDGGIVWSDRPPPQQLFEIGANQNLPGYGYKEFAGNRAAVLRGLVMYPLPLWRAPLRMERWVFPAIAPFVSVGAQSGWADASDTAAAGSVARLGRVGDPVLGATSASDRPPVSRPTDGILSTVDFRVRFFGGAVSIGAARAVDRRARWRLVFGFAQVL